MKHYSNFIFLFFTLILVQSADSDPNSFYQKLLTTTATTTTNRPKFLLTYFPTKVKPPAFSTRTFYEQYYFKTQTKPPYMNGPGFDIDMDEIRKVQKFMQERSSSYFGQYNKKGSHYHAPKSIGGVGVILQLLVLLTAVMSCWIYKSCAETDYTIVPAINNRSSIVNTRELSLALTETYARSRYLRETQPHTQPHTQQLNLQNLEMQSSFGNKPLTNSIEEEEEVPVNDNSRVGKTATNSTSLPIYNDMIP